MTESGSSVDTDCCGEDNILVSSDRTQEDDLVDEIICDDR